MSDYREEDQLNREEGFSLEEILAEFANYPSTEEPPEQEDAPQQETPPEEETLPEEETPPEEEAPPEEEVSPVEEPPPEEEPPPAPRPGRQEHRGGTVTPFPDRKTESPPPSKTPPPVEEEDNLVEFPAPEATAPVIEGLEHLRRKANEFAGHMFEEEGTEDSEDVRRAERLIPGVDEEERPPAPARERKPRKTRPAPPDVPPAELLRRYKKGLKFMRLRTAFMFLLSLALLYLTAAGEAALPLPAPLAEDPLWRYTAMAAIQGMVILLGIDSLALALGRVLRLSVGLDTLGAVGSLFVLADAVMLILNGQFHRQPYCVVAAFSLWCLALGNYDKRLGNCLACRTAAAASSPYLVTRDTGKWNGRDTYTKWSGDVAGFGSQIQAEDGAERMGRVMAPVLLVACLLFSLISALGNRRPEDLVWCLASTLTAAAPLSATLCFGVPWRRLSARLGKVGAALAGWEGVTNTTGKAGLLLTDTDLFAPGSVQLNGMKVFGEISAEKVVAVTATVIRDSGCGLERVFHDLLRSMGGVYRRGQDFTAHEGGGYSETIRGQQVLVGSAAFMTLMDVEMPQGVSVKNAVFCALDGELVGIFALNYHLAGAAPIALDSLIRDHIVPVLATRDFNLIPSVLRQRFKLPSERMEFPPVERRRELSEPEQEHDSTLTAVLCREGVGPYAEAVVGGRRLRVTVRLATVVACVGAVAGALLAFYLTFVAAYDSLTPLSLLFFLLMWLTPTLLISGWADRY